MSLSLLKRSSTLPNLRSQINSDSVKVLEPATVSVGMLQGEFDAKAVVQVGDVVKAGQLIGLKDLPNGYVPIYSPVSGEVTSIVKKMSAKLKPCEHVVITNDFKGEKLPLENNISVDSTKEEIVDFMKTIGLMETKALAYQKYNNSSEILVVSLVEDGPYLLSNVAFAKANKEAFKLGVELVQKVCGATTVYVVSGANDPFNETIEGTENRILEESYPLNDKETIEKMLNIKDSLVVEGRTLVHLGQICSTGVPVYDVLVTVAGDSIEKPALISCPIGTSCSDLLTECCCKEGTHNLIIGNLMNGTIVTSGDVTVTQVVHEVTVLPYVEDKDFTCIRCGRCADVCPMGLIPMEIAAALKQNDVDKLGKLDVLACSECGLCAYECPSDIEITESVRRAKRIYNLRRKK